jgi:hypothetical protein
VLLAIAKDKFPVYADPEGHAGPETSVQESALKFVLVPFDMELVQFAVPKVHCALVHCGAITPAVTIRINKNFGQRPEGVVKYKRQRVPKPKHLIAPCQ